MLLRISAPAAPPVKSTSTTVPITSTQVPLTRHALAQAHCANSGSVSVSGLTTDTATAKPWHRLTTKRSLATTGTAATQQYQPQPKQAKRNDA